MSTHLALLFTTLLTQGEPLPAVPITSPVVMESAVLSVKLNRRGILHAVTDKRNGNHAFVLQTAVPWEVDVRHATSPEPSGDLPRAALMTPATAISCIVSNSGVVRSGGAQLTQYRWDCSFKVPNDSTLHSLSVQQWYELGDGDDFVQTWGHAALASTTLSIRDLRFPLGIRDDPAITEYATTTSYVIEATREPAARIELLDFRFALQNVLGGYWNDLGYYLYLLSDDSGYSPKSVIYSGDGSVFTTTVKAPAVNQYLPGNTAESPYRLRIGVGRSALRGEEAWISIADVYRSHLQSKGSLSVPVELRKDIPDVVKNLDLLFYAGNFAYPMSPTEMNALASAYRDAKDYHRAESASLLMWETGAAPYLTYTPLPTQVAFYRTLRSVGEILPCLYTAFAMASIDDPAYPAIERDVNFLSHLRREPILRGAPGNLAAVFDPHSTLFTDWMIAKLDVFNADGAGIAGVYVDNTHDNGGWHGGLWNPGLDGVRRYGVTEDTMRGPHGHYTRITAAMQARDPDFFMCHESSIPSSHFAGGPAVQSTTGLLFGSWAHPAEAQSIVQNFHFLERVFGGYNVRQGAAIGESNLRILEFMPYVLNKAASGTEFDIHDDFDAVYAVAVLQGGGAPAEPEYGIRKTRDVFSAMPNYRARHPLYNRDAADWDVFYRDEFSDLLVEHAAFLRDLIELRRLGRKHFHGQWQPLPPTGSPSDLHEFRNVGTGRRTNAFTIPLGRVVGAAWKAWDGDLGLFYANHYRNSASEPAAVDIDFARYGLEPGRRHQLFDLATNKSLGSYTSSFRFSFTLGTKKTRGFYLRKVPG